MKQVLQLEELIMCLAALAGLYYLDAAWYIYLGLMIAPDISMLGYLGGNKTGAVCYNIFHHKATGLLLLGFGLYFQNSICIYAGIIIFGHASLDRIFGYGLKHTTGFAFTHLGKIGRRAEV